MLMMYFTICSVCVQALVDVQLWSQSDYKGISVIGHNEVGCVGICVGRSWDGMALLTYSYSYCNHL